MAISKGFLESVTENREELCKKVPPKVAKALNELIDADWEFSADPKSKFREHQYKKALRRYTKLCKRLNVEMVY